jgi:hypothetical protein
MVIALSEHGQLNIRIQTGHGAGHHRAVPFETRRHQRGKLSVVREDDERTNAPGPGQPAKSIVVVRKGERPPKANIIAAPEDDCHEGTSETRGWEPVTGRKGDPMWDFVGVLLKVLLVLKVAAEKYWRLGPRDLFVVLVLTSEALLK